MKNRINRMMTAITKNARKRGALKSVTMFLACVMVFVTTYALILPAITMSNPPRCGFVEHRHSDECYKSGKLICGLAEHVHSSRCFDEADELTASSENYSVTVKYNDSAKIPEGAKLSVTEFSETSEEFNQAKAAVIDYKTAESADFDAEQLGIMAIDVTLTDANGKEIEPSAGIQVAVERNDFAGQLDENVVPEDLQVQHLVTDNNALTVRECAVIQPTENEGSNLTANLPVNSLSPFVLTWRISYRASASFNFLYKDTEGNDITDMVAGSYDESITSGQSVDVTAAPYVRDIDGYTFQTVQYNGQDITGIYVAQEGSWYTTYSVYFLNGEYSIAQESVSNRSTTTYNVDIIYEKNNTPTQPTQPTDPDDPAADDLSKLPDPNCSKTLTPNNDGTYTLTLTVKVPETRTETSNRANIVIIFDSSNSMKEATYYYEDSNGKYGTVNGKDFDEIYDGYIYDREKRDWVRYTGKKYSPGPDTRMSIAKKNVADLGKNLLSYNDKFGDGTVELALVEFASRIRQPSNITDVTSDYSQFSKWVDACSAPGDNDGATNWEAALMKADEMDFGDDDPKYIIFISDGNPTMRVTQMGYGEDDLLTDGTVHGTGNSDVYSYNFDAAKAEADRIVAKGTTLYNIGIFGDADRMINLGGHGYYDASEASAMNDAFNDIIKSISAIFGYKDVTVSDGITSMTSTALVSGNPDNYTYNVIDQNGNDVTDTLTDEQKKAQYTEVDKISAQGIPYKEKQVVWDLGKDKLLSGGTYSVSFIVWPDQASYDLVADLNNGKRSFSELNDVEQLQVRENEGVYSIKTNTEASVSYVKVKEVTDSDGNVTTETKPGEITLEPPKPMPLDDSNIAVQKVWTDTLDPTELEELVRKQPEFNVSLDLMRVGDNGAETYFENIVIKPPTAGVVERNKNGEAVWPYGEKIHISLGLMVSEENANKSGLVVEGYPSTTFNGKTYYILERGHDFFFRENNADYHFELNNHVFHPMVVDGIPMDVTFGEGNTVQSITNLDTITAQNSMKGGINITKKIVDAYGKEITDDLTTEFTVHCSILNAQGEPYTAANEELQWRIVYAAGGKSPKENIPDSSDFELKIKVGDTLRLINVPYGSTYAFYEVDNPDDKYQFKLIEGHNLTRNGAGEYIDADSSMIYKSDDGTILYGTTISNAAQNVEITNTIPESTLQIKKVDIETGKILLPGAQFELYTELNADKTGKTRAKNAKNEEFSFVTTDKNGTASFERVLFGKYYLIEEKAPEGYNTIIEPIEVVVDKNGVQFTQNGNSASVDTYLQPEEKTSPPLYVLTVANSRGVTLPATGGIGTEIYMVCGTALIALSAAVYLYISRRKIVGRRRR